MSTAAIEQKPMGPQGHATSMGVAKLQIKRRASEKAMRAEGRLQPATIVNLNLFPLKVFAGKFARFTVPARKEGEAFAFFTVTEPDFAFPFKGMIQTNNGTDLVADYDIIPVLPVEQAMEFRRCYMESSQDMSGGVLGGVLVFEGQIELLEKFLDGGAKDQKLTVRIPIKEYLEDGTGLVTTEPKLMHSLWEEANETLQLHCMNKIQEAHSFHSDPLKVKEITKEHRGYAILAIEKGWATVDSLPWLNHSPAPETLCKKCRKPLPAGAYMCGNCSKVVDPVRAYAEGDIEFNHVSFQILDAAGWKAVKKIKAERDKAAAAE